MNCSATYRKAKGISPWMHDWRKRMSKMAIDPVCKMEVDEKMAKWKTTYGGKEYFFCAPGCKKTFEKNPSKFV